MLEHGRIPIVIRGHTEGLGVLASLIRRSLWHRLSCLPIALIATRLGCCYLILRHQSVVLLSDDSRVVEVECAARLLHSLKVGLVMKLADIDGLVANVLGCRSCHCKALTERH